MSGDPRRTLGAIGERHAEDLLRSAGYRVLTRNFRTREGELDLVVADRRHLVFCEVKTRLARSWRAPSPLEGVGRQKRRRVRLMARRWMSAHPGARPRPPETRFDAIGVTVRGDGALVEIEHLEDAFR